MKNNFIPYGKFQLLRGQKDLSSELVREKFAKELAVASPEQKEKIQKQIQKELLRQQNHKPSAATLW